MPVVDYERAWLRLKAHLKTKPAHGANDLIRHMTDLEIDSEIPEAGEAFDSRPLPRPHQASDGVDPEGGRPEDGEAAHADARCQTDSPPTHSRRSDGNTDRPEDRAAAAA